MPDRRRYGVLVAIFAFSVAIATVYGRYHFAADALAGIIDLGDAPSCSFCGSIMTRNGSCYRCGSCGSTSGCS